MPDNRRGRARRPRRARFQRFVNTVSRSWLIESLVRSLIIMLVVFGMLLTGYGLLAEVGAFSTDLTKLVQFAGSGDAVVSSTLDLFRGQVLAMLGLAKPVLTEEEVSMLPQTGALYATATPFAPARKLALGKAAAAGTPDPAGAEAGFLPYQVEATALQQEAPPLPSPGAGDTAAARPRVRLMRARLPPRPRPRRSLVGSSSPALVWTPRLLCRTPNGW